MLEPDFLTMGTTTVSVEPFSEFTVNGAPTCGAAASWPCRVDAQRRLFPRPDGQTDVATATLYVLSTSATIGLADRLTMPGTTGVTPRIMDVFVSRDEDGQHHLEVAVG